MRVGLRVWMTMVGVLIVLLTVAVMLLYSVPVARERLEGYDLDRLTAQAAVTADSVADGEGRGLRHALDLAANTDNREALFVDRDGRVVGRAGPRLLPSDEPEVLREAAAGGRMFEEVGGLDVAVVPVYYGGEARGGVVLASRGTRGGVFGFFFRSVVEAALVACVLAGGLALLLASLLGRRVERLASGARAVECGDLSRRIEPGFGDELGQLALTFNAMTGKLEDSFSRLEERVAERTGELEAERARLEAVLRQMPSGVVIAEAPSGEVVLSNERAERIRGHVLPRHLGDREIGGYEGRPDGRPYAPDEWPLVRTIRTGEEVSGEEIELSRGDGTRVTVRVDSSPIRDRDGRIVAGVAVFEDVTEQRRAEEALRESEARFRAAFEQAAVGMAEDAPDGRMLKVNEKLSEILGCSKGELLGRTFRDFTHPDDLGQNDELVRRLLAGETETFSVEKRYVRKDGSVIWGNVSGSVVRKPSGEPGSIIAVVQDVTERKRAEEEIRRLALRNESLLECAGEGIFGLDLEGKATFVNPAAAGMLGYEPGELVGRGPHDLVHHSRPDGSPYPAKECSVYAALGEGETRRVSDEVFWRKDGTSFPVEYVSTPVKEGGRITGAVVTFDDVTERKEAEQEICRLNEDLEKRVRERTAELERERRKLGAVLTNLSEGVLAADAEGRVVFANPASRVMLGDGGVPERVPNPWRELDLPRAAARASGERESIVARVGDARSLLQVRLEPLPGLDGGRDGALVVIRDLSEGRRLEMEQQRFLANAAHELKTPLTAILGAAELLEEEDEDPEVRRRFLGRILQEARRMFRLSETMLKLARTGTDLREPNLRPVEIGDVARRSVESMEVLARGAGLAISVEGRGGRARADEEWLEEALLILLVNAVKHSGRGTHVRVGAEGGNIAVEDEGVGIPQEDLPHVFERFYRGRGDSGGFGLGLPICKELVRRMGGDVRVESKEGTGAKFEIRLMQGER